MTPYIALYRKYRPRSFAELVGQEAVAKTLASAIKQNRLAHAYLFCGPRGTGKTSVARILAKSVNCKQGPTDFPCEECSNCREITLGNSLDVIEIDAASNNGVDNIRDLQDRVALAPVTGRYKTYIIDEVHMLSQGAFNALLKTLEEPPPNVLFILATTDPHKVLPTIISRCQRFDFGRIALGPLVGRLRHVADAEGINVETPGLEAIARRAGGGLRDALSLLDQIAAMADGQPIASSDVALSLGLLSGESVCALSRALLTGDVPAALEQTQAILAAGYDHGTLLRELLGHMRHLMVLQLAPDRADALEVPLAQIDELRAQTALAETAELTWVLEVLNETEAVLRRSPQQAIWLELGLIKIARRPSIPSLIELAGRVAALEARLSEPGVAQGASRPAARPAPLPPRQHIAPPPTAQPAAQTPAVASPAPVAPPVAVPAPPAYEAAVAPGPMQPAYSPAVAPATPSLTPPGLKMPPRPPMADVPVPAHRPAEAPAAVVSSAPPTPASVGGLRPVPPAAWDRVREHVRSRSVPTAALLDQQAMIDRWEEDGAVVIRIAKAYKDMFDRQANKKKILLDAVLAVFGKDAFPRLEVGDPKGPSGPQKTASHGPPGQPAQVPAHVVAPVSYQPTQPATPAYTAPAATPPASGAPAVPAPTYSSEPPDDDSPPDWLNDLDDSRPPEGPQVERTAPGKPEAAPVRATVPQMSAKSAAVATPTVDSKLEEGPLKLTVELFNGRVIRPPDGNSV